MLQRNASFDVIWFMRDVLSLWLALSESFLSARVPQRSRSRLALALAFSSDQCERPL